ncbi:TPA: MerR family transcriptional regulator [Burkholderia cenocepacia]|uniref:MerR family transcriptional regulator n=1 Tax=unclassified Burkholderia TaxID=2613784 RepID=UPI00158AAF9B|nr:MULTISPECIES: MerR family transcriptional regulator [unclassified Burkholderia]HEF5872507.1 MerR family transcriptional regulator [Burkholderia cenocepacia]HEF5876015.1 MerR family transcriptional regulator [Burkholderia cenocepacia]
MKIGELAQRTGLAPSRIRFYERIGLLTLVEREANGYRAYPQEAVTVLDLIAAAQRADFSLDEIRTLVPSDLAQWQCGPLLDALCRKVQDIEALEARLARSKAHVVALIAGIGEKSGTVDCATHAKRLRSRMPSAHAARTGDAAASDLGDQPAPRRTTAR